jgi:hypothetical protein
MTSDSSPQGTPTSYPPAAGNNRRPSSQESQPRSESCANSAHSSRLLLSSLVAKWTCLSWEWLAPLMLHPSVPAHYAVCFCHHDNSIHRLWRAASKATARVSTICNCRTTGLYLIFIGEASPFLKFWRSELGHRAFRSLPSASRWEYSVNIGRLVTRLHLLRYENQHHDSTSGPAIYHQPNRIHCSTQHVDDDIQPNGPNPFLTAPRPAGRAGLPEPAGADADAGLGKAVCALPGAGAAGRAAVLRLPMRAAG